MATAEHDLLGSLLNEQPGQGHIERLAPEPKTQPVRSYERTKPGAKGIAAPAKKTAFISRTHIARQVPQTDRVVAFLVLCGSFLGAVTLIYGWQKPAWSAQFGIAMGIAFLAQGFLTFWQWQHTPFYGLQNLSGGRRAVRVLKQLDLKYTVAVLAGVALSVGGYNGAVSAWLLSTAAGITADPARQSQVAWAAMIIVCLLIEVIPESVYVDD